MRIPYVIDNQTYKMADVLNGLLRESAGRSLDVATAYFAVGGFEVLREGLKGLGSFRLLLGAEPHSGDDVGLEPGAGTVRGLIKQDLNDLPFEEATLRVVEELIAYLRRKGVAVRLYEKGFLHAKCYLFYADLPDGGSLFERFRPLAAIVGSSNLTRPGLTSNRELNLSHKVLLEPEEALDDEAAMSVSWLTDDRPMAQVTPVDRQVLKSEVGARAIIDLERWYERQWGDSRDFTEDLIALLDESKFGEKEYTPYEVYMKALYEYLKGDLGEEETPATRSAVDLAEFQEDAVKKARRVLMRYDGVMIADSVGLGKTWIGKKLLEDFAYHMRQKAVIVCPAALRQMWENELREATIAAQVVSQEELGRDTLDVAKYHDADIVLIDESHNFRNPNTGRYENIERLIGGNRGRGRDGARKKVVLLTATPINNDLFDLYNQLRLITQNDLSYFSTCGIGDLRRYFLRARRASRGGGGSAELFNLLEEIVVRRTRPFIKRAYPNATIRGKKIHFPDRRLRTVSYDLEGMYAGIYDDIVSGVESLNLAPYSLETYKKEGVEQDEFEVGRETALVGIFKSRYLKRFESSVDAFRISVRRALAFLETFESYVLDGKLLRSDDFRKAIRYLQREDEEDDATPTSAADDIDANDEARQVLEGMETIAPEQYDLRRLHKAVRQDITTLTEIWHKVSKISPEYDSKLQRLKMLLSGDLRGKKVLVFTYYKDTARYLYRNLGDPKNDDAAKFIDALGGVTIRRMDGGSGAKDRVRIVQGFAPESNGKPEWVGTDREIDILISTDVLSEGQNLQDCGIVVNFDLHWNPTRMVQRAGRVDRIGSKFQTLWLYNMFPDEGLERLLRLVQRLNQRIADIDSAGFLDASVLGETVHPQNFNTLRRIREEDGSVIQEEEEFSELASSEFLEQTLRNVIDLGGKESLESLPDGIHSGLVRPGAKGVFFYFQGKERGGGRRHFWRYYNLRDESIIDNRYLIANLIACDRDTPRVVEPETFARVFDIQERVIADILQKSQEQQALETAPRTIDAVQQTVATTLQGFLNHPDVDRQTAIALIRFLNQPMLGVQIKELRKNYADFQANSNVSGLLKSLSQLQREVGGLENTEATSPRVAKLTREDLHLICFDFLSGG